MLGTGTQWSVDEQQLTAVLTHWHAALFFVSSGEHGENKQPTRKSM